MAKSFRMRLNQSREQRLEDLTDATGQNTLSKAVDAAIRTYLRLVGENMVQPGRGILNQLLKTAEERGGLSASEIAEILSTDDLPVHYEPATWVIGTDE